MNYSEITKKSTLFHLKTAAITFFSTNTYIKTPILNTILAIVICALFVDSIYSKYLIFLIILLILCVILSLFFTYYESKNENEIIELKNGYNIYKDENSRIRLFLNTIIIQNEYEIKEILRSLLVSFIALNNCSQKKRKGNHKSHRINAYIYYPKSDKFILISRYSTDNEFDKRTRYIYNNNGILKLAFKYGDCLRQYSDYQNDIISYYSELAKDGISEEEAEKIRMKSSFIYGKVLTDESNQPFGVIIIESLKKTLSNQKNIEQYMISQKTILENLSTQLREVHEFYEILCFDENGKPNDYTLQE